MEQRDTRRTQFRLTDAGGNPLARKLSNFMQFSPADLKVLDDLLPSEEAFAADTDIVSEAMIPRSAFVMLQGMAVRYRALADGGRQIMTFLIPGDICDIHIFLAQAMDHSIGTITPVRLAPISREMIVSTVATHPRIAAALWWSSMQEEAMLRERIVSLGRRDARGRLAYLLCELLWRHAAVGLAHGTAMRLPLTQTELGDALGLTPVHVNRVLKDFRERRLLTIDHGLLTIIDIDQLKHIADFTPGYLRLQSASAEMTNFFDRLESQQDAANIRSSHGHRC